MTASVTFVGETLTMMVESVAGAPMGESSTTAAWDTGHALTFPDGDPLAWVPMTYAEDRQREYQLGARHFANWPPQMVMPVVHLCSVILARADAVQDSLPGSPILREKMLLTTVPGWAETIALCKAWRGDIGT